MIKTPTNSMACPHCGQGVPPDSPQVEITCSECGARFTPKPWDVSRELAWMRHAAMALIASAFGMTLWFLLALELEVGLFGRSFYGSQGFDAMVALARGTSVTVLLPCQVLVLQAMIRMWWASRTRPNRRWPKALSSTLVVSFGAVFLVFVGTCVGAVSTSTSGDAGSAEALRFLVSPAGELFGIFGALIGLVLVLIGPVALLSICVGCMTAASQVPGRRAVRWMAWLTATSSVLPLGMLLAQVFIDLPLAILTLAMTALLILTWVLGGVAAIPMRAGVTRTERLGEPHPATDEQKAMKWAAPILLVGLLSTAWDVIAAPGPGEVYGLLAGSVRMNLALLATAAWVVPWALCGDRLRWKYCFAAGMVALGAIAVRIACFMV